MLVVLATAVAWAGAIAAGLVRHSGSRIMRPLIYVALLFFGLSAVVDILPRSKAALDWPTFSVAALLGYGIFWAIGRYVAPICPACAFRSVEHDHQHTHGTGLALLVIVLAIHCVLDGLGISAASAVQGAFGMRVFAAIAVHKLPEGFALAMMLIAGSQPPSRAVATTLAVETATLAGAALGAVWTTPSAYWLAILLAHIGGTFLYLAVTGFWEAFSPPLIALE
ncbi:MAG TPA: ZIP family metal transporter [Vicinamibacterales bacterium]|nr:ZIP family metal transporter [Vicinamibacterales bacterium]